MRFPTSGWENGNMAEKGVNTAAVVLAAGRGKRMQADIAKQYMLLKGKPLLYYSLKAFEDSDVDSVVLVTGEEEIDYCRKEIVEKYGFSKVDRIVAGGRERYHSVFSGLSALAGSLQPDDIVLIHDGARPLVCREIIERTIQAAAEYNACVAAMPVKDTIKVADGQGFSSMTPDRSTLWQIQTPQTFRYGVVYGAYSKLFMDEQLQAGITDDAMVVEAFSAVRVKLIEGSYQNIKVTTPEDLTIAECFLNHVGQF